MADLAGRMLAQIVIEKNKKIKKVLGGTKMLVLGQENNEIYQSGIAGWMENAGIDLPTAQIRMGSFIDLELVPSIKGVSIRYATGLENFRIYRSGTGHDYKNRTIKADAGFSEAWKVCKIFVEDSNGYGSVHIKGDFDSAEDAIIKLVLQAKKDMEWNLSLGEKIKK